MRASFDRWWLLPLGILTASALVVLGLVVFGLSSVGRSSDEVAPQSASRVTTDCSGALASDYTCHQERYQNLVQGSGVEAAFAELKDEYRKNDFVKSNCHQLVHVIGRAAANLYGDVPGTYAQGDDFCSAGYYHGAMETFVADIGAEKILEEAGTLCADLREDQNHSFDHHNCAHGLGHGFMGIQQNELFESLATCDVLVDEWERDRCYSGVFMENLMAGDDPSHPSKYLRANQPLYPCTDVETRHKNRCYEMQIQYALQIQGGDFVGAFDLCESVEEDFRQVCYQGLGNHAAGQSIQQNITAVAQTGATNNLCALAEDHAARSDCVAGAVKGFVLYFQSDEQAGAFCGSVEADLRGVCLRAAEESMAFRSGPE